MEIRIRPRPENKRIRLTYSPSPPPSPKANKKKPFVATREWKREQKRERSSKGRRESKTGGGRRGDCTERSSQKMRWEIKLNVDARSERALWYHYRATRLRTIRSCCLNFLLWFRSRSRDNLLSLTFACCAIDASCRVEYFGLDWIS